MRCKGSYYLINSSVALLTANSVECRNDSKVLSDSNNEYLSAINFRLFKYLTSNFIKNKPYPGARTYIDYTITRLSLRPSTKVIYLFDQSICQDDGR